MTQRKSVAFAAVEAVENVTQYLRVPRLISIRSRILALAVLGTVIPAGISLGVAYTQNRRAREEKVTQELRTASAQTAGALNVWLKERLYDLRVFATSDEVSNNLNRNAQAAAVGGRLREYLRSLHVRFTDFDQLVIVDQQGRVLATSANQQATVPLPPDWQGQLRKQGQLIGNPYWDRAASRGKLVLAVPVQRSDGRLAGAFAAELTLAPIQHQLRQFLPDSSRTIYLAAEDGALIASTREVSSALLDSRLKPAVRERLIERENAVVRYSDVRGAAVVGTMKRVPQVNWGVISQMPADAAYRDVRQFRNAALLTVFILLLVVAATAYYLGHIIVRPLERLAQGAAEVSLGDFDVDLPTTGGGEVGVLTGVFNRMVKQLREGREELERLSVTDGLTGLTNHRALMQRLHEEAQRSGRSNRAFTLIMADVDHFKSYNDTFGHPAGDEVLKRVAAILKDCTRAVDCVARYGGEEFAVLLPETELAGGVEVAERIRSRIEQERFPERAVAMSLGVAEFPGNADRVEQIVAVADAALYEAKHGGRNRVVRSKARRAKSAAAEKVLPAAPARRPARAKRKD